MHTAPETLQNEMVFDPNLSKIKKWIQPLPHGERTINESAAHIKLHHAEKSQKLDNWQGPECWLEGHALSGVPYSAAWHHIVTFCKFWKWLPLIFRIRRSSSIMLKPLMRSHCKATCYRKLANCFGRATAIGDIHVWEWLPLIFRIRRSSSIMLKPMMRSHCKATCYTKLASCFGRVTAVGDIHVSITRNVADPQSCWNHWCEAIAKPCAIRNWPIVGRVTAVGDIHVSITRNVADPQSCWNHWCEAIAKPCVYAPGQRSDWVVNTSYPSKKDQAACSDTNDSTLHFSFVVF